MSDIDFIKDQLLIALRRMDEMMKHIENLYSINKKDEGVNKMIDLIQTIASSYGYSGVSSKLDMERDELTLKLWGKEK